VSATVEMTRAANELPEVWDALATNSFQKRAFLHHCEKYNPCAQRYYTLEENGSVLGGAIVYSLKLDLLTFLEIRSPLTMQMVGVPCSVDSSGLLGTEADHTALLRAIIKKERGLLLALNLESVPRGLPLAVGKTWPGVVLENRYATWAEYESALRSPYRRRLEHILRVEEGLRSETGSCDRFTPAMHEMYLEVYRRSRGKLERLSCEFFRNLPETFQLTTIFRDADLSGWFVTLVDGERFFFFLGGQKYDERSHEVYLVKLASMIRQGIASGARQINLGQSAEVPKMRMGGTVQEKIMVVHHHRPVFQAALHASIGMLAYHRRFQPAHVFKEGQP